MLIIVGHSTEGTNAKLPGTLPPPSNRGDWETSEWAGVAASAMASDITKAKPVRSGLYRRAKLSIAMTPHEHLSSGWLFIVRPGK